MVSAGPDSTPLKWAGQHEYQSDLPLGLSHVGARQYDSFTGRFLNRDPIEFAGGANLYRQCEHDMAGGAHPRGLFFETASSAYVTGRVPSAANPAMVALWGQARDASNTAGCKFVPADAY
jgi:RHS repeat-associated protein